MNLEALGLLITSVLTPISVVVVGILANRKAKELTSTTRETMRMAAEIDHAVNGRGPRQTTLEQDMKTVMDKQETDSPSEQRGLVQIVEELLVELKKTNGTSAQ